MEPGFVQIIHPGLGPDSVSEVPESSLYQHYQSGWRLLAEGDIPPAAPPRPPRPMTRAEAAKAAEKTEEN